MCVGEYWLRQVVLLKSVLGGGENGPDSCTHRHLARGRGATHGGIVHGHFAHGEFAYFLGGDKTEKNLAIYSILQGPFCPLPMLKTSMNKTTRDQSVLEMITQMKIYP